MPGMPARRLTPQGVRRGRRGADPPGHQMWPPQRCPTAAAPADRAWPVPPDTPGARTGPDAEARQALGQLSPWWEASATARRRCPCSADARCSGPGWAGAALTEHAVWGASAAGPPRPHHPPRAGLTARAAAPVWAPSLPGLSPSRGASLHVPEPIPHLGTGVVTAIPPEV